MLFVGIVKAQSNKAIFHTKQFVRSVVCLWVLLLPLLFHPFQEFQNFF